MVVAPSLDEKLQRIAGCAANAQHSDLYRSLLYAYAACLSVEEVFEAAIRTIDAPITVRNAVRIRLGRIGEQTSDRKELDQFGNRVLALAVLNAKSRERIDSLLWHLYGLFSPPVRESILERWKHQGTRRARGRWLKAVSGDELLFSVDDVAACWRATRDARAAKLLAYRADESLLTEILPELANTCDEGWIVSRAALRAGAVPEECWEVIRSRFPASYAYICAKVRRPLTDKEAVQLVVESGMSWPSNERGLAIWALGQLGMWQALETVNGMVPQLHEEDLAQAMPFRA